MGRAWLSLGLVVLVGAAVPLACGQKFELTGGTGTGTGTGGSIPATSSGGGDTSSTGGAAPTSTSTTTSTGSGICATTADCTSPPTECGEAYCVNGHCGFKATHEDGSLKSQVYGDCHERKCKGGLLLDEENKDDVYDDANECTEDLCENGVPTHKPVNSGDPCTEGGVVCDGKGACVQCAGNTDCVSPLACRLDHCLPESCYDNAYTPVGMETDVDCGGPLCVRCSDNKKCLSENDCESGVCEIPPGQSQHRCIPASCADMAKNGNETAKDCGGPDCLNKCAPGEGCSVPGDCKSGVCKSGKCLVSSCTDGVKNGNEAGVDCGANCPPCLGG